MLGTGDVGKAQVTLARRRPSFCPDGNLDEGPIFGAVPQLVLLNEVDTQDERFIQVGNDEEVVLYFFGANLGP